MEKFSTYEGGKESKRQKWAKNLAKEMEVAFTGEFFQIPQIKNGKDVLLNIPAWEDFPLYNDKLEQIGSVKINIAIDAAKMFPDLELSEAIRKLQNKNK